MRVGNSTVPASGLAVTTSATFGASGASLRKTSRHRRRIRFRSAAFGVVFLATITEKIKLFSPKALAENSFVRAGTPEKRTSRSRVDPTREVFRPIFLRAIRGLLLGRNGGEEGAAFAGAAQEGSAATRGAGAGQEPVGSGALSFLGLVRSRHIFCLLRLVAHC